MQQVYRTAVRSLQRAIKSQPHLPFHRSEQLVVPTGFSQPLLNIRHNTTSTSSQPSTSAKNSSPHTKRPAQPLPHRPAPHRNPDEPVYEIHFTCRPCRHRSAHTISKQGYHSGSVLIQCPGCKNRHLISDHLHIFSDTSVTIEEILAQKGEAIRKGVIDGDEEIEFWQDEGAVGVETEAETKIGAAG